jgi:signal transduction histidine kinase
LAARLQTVREEERTRLAREIHDEIGQALTAIKIDLSAWARQRAGDTADPADRARTMLTLVDETIQLVRRIATELRPGILDDLGLVAAIEWAAKEFQQRTGIACHASLPDSDITLDVERATAFFRIFQETLTNVARHAAAREVNVRLAWEDGALHLVVHDDGVGITDEQLAGTRSLGIVGMRERALLLGGEFTIDGRPDAGTTVSVRIPEAR